MADLTVTAAQLRPLEVIEARLIPMIAGEDISKGEVVYRATDGHAELAQADDDATSQVVGIATSDAKAGTPFDALYHGRLAGFGLSGVNPGSLVYLSAATAGKLADTAPSTSTNVIVPIGTVHSMTDVSGTKFLFVDIAQAAIYAEVPAE